MVGAYAAHAPQFLLAGAVVFTLLFAVPMFVSPLSWARAMGFRIPADTDLAVYFGRCLGALALVINAVVVRAAFTGAGIVLVFEIGLAFSVLMVLVHVYGAIKGIQPFTETVEIALWALFVWLYLVFFPVTSVA